MDSKQIMADVVFLALTIWREARGESRKCQEGVACCIMNRVHRPSWWGTDVMSVCFKKWQFSSLTDPNDKQLTTWPKSDDVAWQQCLEVANCAITGWDIINPVPGADSYYDTSIPTPKWATDETFVRQIDKIRFYNLDRDIETAS